MNSKIVNLGIPFTRIEWRESHAGGNTHRRIVVAVLLLNNKNEVISRQEYEALKVATVTAPQMQVEDLIVHAVEDCEETIQKNITVQRRRIVSQGKADYFRQAYGGMPRN